MVTGPCAIAVLQADNLLRDVRMPFRPGVAADALHAVADVEIGEELLAAHRPESADEGCIGELPLNRTDLPGVLRSVRRGAAQLLERLSALVQCDACGFGGRGGGAAASPPTDAPPATLRAAGGGGALRALTV